MRTPIYICIIFCFLGCVKTKEADLVVHNAFIYINPAENINAEAFAVKNGKIIEYGAEHQIMNKYQAKKYVDAGKKPVIPGLIDANCYFMETGLLAEFPFYDFSNASIEAVKQKLLKQKQAPLWGYGIDLTNEDILIEIEKFWLEHLNSQDLYLKAKDGLSILKFSRKSESFGDLKAFDQNPEVFMLIDSLQATLVKESLIKAQKIFYKNGITTAAQTQADSVTFFSAIELAKQGTLSIDLVFYFQPDFESSIEKWKNFGLPNNIKVGGLDIFIDGGYKDGNCLLSSNHSLFKEGTTAFVSDSAIQSHIISANNGNYQLLFRAFGDSAAEVISKNLKIISPSIPDHRWRVDHLQFIKRGTLKLLTNHNLIPGTLPSQLKPDSKQFNQSVKNDELLYPLKSLKSAIQLFAIGSLSPIPKLNIGSDLYYSLHHPIKKKESISKLASLTGYTLYNSLAIKSEEKLGTLEPEMQADFNIISKGWDLSKPDTMQLKCFKKGVRVFPYSN